MADLEDRILRQNVPGRWSALDSTDDIRRDEAAEEPGDGDEGGGGTRDDTDHDGGTDGSKQLEMDRLLNDSNIPFDVKRGIMAERSRKAGTGIKVFMLINET